ncbi:membrane protein [Streptomyces phage Belfort]|uniref:Membrane protein n=1 Tax=Streptomyces phage Belfort TaxID=2801887 RepID=A0A7T7Z9X2_9CAUD|nr:membrane protein [Streptomyces phage Belfort]
MEKKWIYTIFGGVLVAVVLLVVTVLNVDTTKTKFETYQNYAKQVNLVDWSISEDTAESFAKANCDKLATGDMPAIRFQNSDHVKSSAAVLAAYCPNSFDNFLAGVIMNNPEYKSTAMYVNERIEVDSR